MTTLLYSDLDASPMADPHGYRVASQIRDRGLSKSGSKQDRVVVENDEGTTSVEAVSEFSAQSQAQVRMVGELSALIDAMRHGDEGALEVLYDATVGKLFALASAILRNAEDAEEVVCSTYTYAWANASRFDGARANALGWLLMLCRSRALDRLRQRRIAGVLIDIDEIAESEASGDQQPDDLLAVLQQRSRVRMALTKLSPERRKLVSLAFLHGLSHQEIASVSGLALGTVKSHVRRALAQLRDALEAE